MASDFLVQTNQLLAARAPNLVGTTIHAAQPVTRRCAGERGPAIPSCILATHEQLGERARVHLEVEPSALLRHRAVTHSPTPTRCPVPRCSQPRRDFSVDPARIETPWDSGQTPL